MPTDEYKKLLDREFSRKAVEPISSMSTPLLQELVNNGLMVFRRCENDIAKVGKENQDVAAFALYRHLIEMVDAIEILVAHSCGTAAIPVLRSAFEGALGLLYLLDDESKYIDRSLSWLVSEMYAAIRDRQTLEPGTTQGRRFAELREKEFAREKLVKPNTEIAQEIQHLESLLKSEQFASVAEEYLLIKKKIGRSPDWFSLFGGPSNRSELAERVGLGSVYQLLYGDWSALSHGCDLRRYFDSDESGRALLEGVRSPTELREIAQLAATLLLRATREMIQKFRKGEDLGPWYAREVKPFMDGLHDLNITFTSIRE